MKKLKFFALVLAGLTFAACSNDDVIDGGTTPETGNKEITVRLAMQTETTTAKSTRALETTPQKDLCAPVNKLDIFVTDAGGTTIYVRDQVTSSIDNANATTKLLEKTYTGLPSSAAYIYVVANSPVSLDSYASIAALKAASFTVISQNDAAYPNASNVILEGATSTLTANGAPVNGIQNYLATVQIFPAVSRLEMGYRAEGVTDKYIRLSTESSNNVTGFQIDGIYLNYYYPNMTLAGTDPVLASGTGTIVDNRTDALLTALTDFSVTTISAAAIPDGKIVAYNFFAGDMPHVLIRLKNITYKAGFSGLTEGWLTVEKYKKGATSFSTAVRGEVYTIGDIVFDQTSIGEEPYTKNISITATITVRPWVGVDLVPEL